MYKNSNKQNLKISEEFVPYGMKQLDSKDRITLGGKLRKAIEKSMGIDGFQVFLGGGGDILLRPTIAVPANEAWIYKNPVVVKKIKTGLKEAGSKKIKPVKDIDRFLNKL